MMQNPIPMKNIPLMLFAFLLSTLTFGQELNLANFKETKIESGSTFKKMKDGKLDSIIVSMAAVNYGNALIFSKTKDEILIKNAADENSLIKITLKNKKQIRTFFYKNKPVMILESIDLDPENLPKNGFISSGLTNNGIASYLSKSSLDEITGNDFPDKSMKLFSRLEINPNLNDLDAIFTNIGDFFSQEDALLRIFYGSYAEEFEPRALVYLKTDAAGKIKDGVLYDLKNQKEGEKNQYHIYKNGKNIQSGTVDLEGFQEFFEKYMNENMDR